MCGSDPRGSRAAADADLLPLRDRAVLVAAHPDDETIGAGGLLPRLTDLILLIVTDGAPRERRWWGAPEIATREEYARIRRQELLAAMGLARIHAEQIRWLDHIDQEASFNLATLARELASRFRELRPRAVLTHPYEGGHPDHDATAFAVHVGCRLLAAAGDLPPTIIEFTSYHAGDSGIVTGCFLPDGGRTEEIVQLSAAERERKQRMLECFPTQRNTLGLFPVGEERFRIAPDYDFTRAPHSGGLFYEHFEWGCTGAEWRERAKGALDTLELSPHEGASRREAAGAGIGEREC